MRHEVRDKNSLFFTMEAILGGVGVTGLTPTCSIYSVSRQEYWNNAASAWSVAKVNNAMSEQDSANHPGLYWLDLSSPNMYDIGEALAGTNPNSSGYIINMVETTNNIVEYIYVTVSDKMSVSAVSSIVDSNVVDWNSTGPTLEKGSVTGFPVISVGGWKDSSTAADIATSYSAGDQDLKLPNINVSSWADNNTGIGVSSALSLPNINISDWGDNSSTLTIGGLTGLPALSVKAWADEDGGLKTDGTSIGGSPGDDIYVSWTEDSDPHGTVVRRPNIRAQIVADNAIDEDAIKIDSVTYEEISDSAIREIVNGVWGANVIIPIDESADLSGSSMSMADPGTMGHSMFLDYFSRNMLHVSGGGAITSAHMCSVPDPSGTKFYSQQLSLDSMDETTEAKSYIDRTAIVAKRLNITTGPSSADYEHHLVRIVDVATDVDGQYFEVKMVDEDESPVPGGFDAPDGFGSFDLLIVKAETDPTMHEVAHEVWEESVFDHETPDTFGMFNRIMTGLSQFNHRITDSIYDDSGRLLSCRLVVYPTACDAKNGTNPLTTVEVTSTYDEKQNMESFLAKQESFDKCD